LVAHPKLQGPWKETRVNRPGGCRRSGV
jgi:hypothetical protein